jgi:anaerobic magnesium-protoporphyrin IX monomethyl ester cyclase
VTNNPENKVLLFNPRSAGAGHRIPLSVLQVGASIFGKFDFVIVDGNREPDPWQIIHSHFRTGAFRYFACTVMPGPQLRQAIPFTRKLKEQFPSAITIWGGYFASNHAETAIRSGFIDYIICGPGDIAFPGLLECLSNNDPGSISEIGSLVYLDDRKNIIRNRTGNYPDMDKLPLLPYAFLNKFHPVESYIVHTFIGRRTISCHTSFGCPHTCAFCGVATVFHSCWIGKSANTIFSIVSSLKNNYRVDAIEFLDSNFFASHIRVIEFCRLMNGQGIRWWGEGRVDALAHYSDGELELLKDAGCCLVFMGAESGSDEVLNRVSKGGTQKARDTLDVARRFREHGIIPQFSFVLGLPESDPSRIEERVNEEIRFIRKIKKINPFAEIILYLYSPVPAGDSDLYREVVREGFSYPGSLEDWLEPEWQQFDLRKDTYPCSLDPALIRHIRDFETVLNAAFPGISNFHIKGYRRQLLRISGQIRYRLKFYRFPLLPRILLKLYRHKPPEISGFYTE